MSGTPEVLNYITDEYEDQRVALIIKSASVIEYEGELMPGLALTPENARTLACDLIVWAAKCELDHEE